MNPWLTNRIMYLIDLKSQYFKLYLDGFVTKNENNIFKNNVKNCIRKTKKAYYNHLFMKSKDNLSNTWKILKNITSYKIDIGKIKKLILNNIELFDDVEIAEVFVDYFSSIASDLDDKLPSSSIDPTSFIEPLRNSMYLMPVSTYEVSAVINNLKSSNHRINIVPGRIFKLFQSSIVSVISDMVNQCFLQGKYPSCLKYAIITPVFKSGELTSPSNYRPIAVTSFLNKIFEKLIHKRLLDFIEQNNILSPYQFGFRQNTSTQDAVINLSEYLYETLNKKEIGVGVFIDYSKAFDTINHAILINKMSKYGVRGIPSNLFKSYLKNRRQVVKIGSFISSARVINIGIPQGTILGPLLFLLYINDLPKITQLCKFIIFADDTALYFRNNDPVSLQNECNTGLQLFHEWSLSNRLTVNFHKTSCILFTNRSIPENNFNIICCNIELKFCEYIRYLGVFIDNKLKFDHHIRNISLKISKSIGILFKAKNLVPFSCMKMLYFSFVYSHLQYCLAIWGGTYPSHMNPLIVLQKRAIRLVFDAGYYDHTANLFYRCPSLKLPDMYNFNLGVLIFQNKIPNVFNRNHGYSTRNRNNLLTDFQRLSITQHSVSYSAAQFWNYIPIQIQNSRNVSIFKYKLKNFFINSYIVTEQDV